MGHPTMQENDTAKLTPTPLLIKSTKKELHIIEDFLSHQGHAEK